MMNLSVRRLSNTKQHEKHGIARAIACSFPRSTTKMLALCSMWLKLEQELSKVPERSMALVCLLVLVFIDFAPRMHALASVGISFAGLPAMPDNR